MATRRLGRAPTEEEVEQGYKHFCDRLVAARQMPPVSPDMVRRWLGASQAASAVGGARG
jgi:hypothetical protein